MKIIKHSILQEARSNDDYRRVLFTSSHSQIVLMSLLAGEDIPLESHSGDQIIYLVEGQASATLNGETVSLHPGDLLIITAGTHHYIVNDTSHPLKLVSFYAPAEHAANTIQKTQADARKQE